MSLTPREELLKLHQKIFKRNEQKIQASILNLDRHFNEYQKRYQRQVSTYQNISSLDELLNKALKAQIVYVGDYHTNKQSQRAFLKLLKLLSQKTKVIVALELLHVKQQPILDSYLNGNLNHQEFLSKIKHRKRWYFDLWENFQSVFDFAKENKILVFGIEAANNERANLKTRDRQSAKVLADLLSSYPDHLILSLVGDLHVVKEHLPACVQEEWQIKHKSKLRDLMICQNSEKIYWKLADAQLEEKVEIVQIQEKIFCLLNTPPIIWQQSYLNWLEHEEGEIEIENIRHHFVELVDQIAQFLTLKLPKAKEDLEVYTSADLGLLKRLEEDSEFSKKEIKAVKTQILNNESYYLAKKKIVYLASLSLNHAAEEAAHFIKHLCSGDEFPRNLSDAFYANVLHEALGFLGSKLINYQRKCMHEKAYAKLVSYSHQMNSHQAFTSVDYKTAIWVMKHKLLEKHEQVLSLRDLKKLNEILFFSLTHALGYMLGDRFFYALLAEKITKEEVKKLFSDPFKKKGEPAEIYLYWVKRLKGVKLPKRV